MFRTQVCPICGAEVEWLDCVVTKGLVERWSLPERPEGALEDPEVEETDILWAEYDCFRCPQCHTTICSTGNEAIEFLKTGKLSSHSS